MHIWKNTIELEDVITVSKDAICDTINLELYPYLYTSDMAGNLIKYNITTKEIENTVQRPQYFTYGNTWW